MNVPDPLRLAILVLILAACDVAATLLGQPPEYWSGDFASADEWNPLGAILLRRHPAVFASAGIAWGALAGFGSRLLPQPFGVVLALAAACGHAIGVACWLGRLGWWGWILAAAFLEAVHRVVAPSWRSDASAD